MTIALLTDSQGKKMGKTAGNAVWLDPEENQPLRLLPVLAERGEDADVKKCLRMLTFLPLEQIDEIDQWGGRPAQQGQGDSGL